MVDFTFKQVQEWVAGWVRNRFFERGQHQMTSSGTQSAGLPPRLNNAGILDPSLTSIDSPLTNSMTIASGDYVIMPRLALGSGVTLYLYGELVLIA